MYVGETLFAQIMDFVPWTGFRHIMARYGGDHRVRTLNCAEQFRVRAFAQLFFRWVKQHLRIKRFYGTTENGVKTQIWTAVAVYVLVVIVKKELHLNASLYTLLQILSVTVFEIMPPQQALVDHDPASTDPVHPNQLTLLGF